MSATGPTSTRSARGGGHAVRHRRSAATDHRRDRYLVCPTLEQLFHVLDQSAEVSTAQSSRVWPYVQIARVDHWFKNAFMLLGVVLAVFYQPQVACVVERRAAAHRGRSRPASSRRATTC